MTYWRLTDPDWDESKHPRKRDGKFAPKGQGESGGAKPKAKAPKGYESHEVIQHASWTRGRLPTVTHHEGRLWAHTPEGVRPATPEDLMPAIRAKASNPEHRLHALVYGGAEPPEPERKPEPKGDGKPTPARTREESDERLAPLMPELRAAYEHWRERVFDPTPPTPEERAELRDLLTRAARLLPTGSVVSDPLWLHLLAEVAARGDHDGLLKAALANPSPVWQGGVTPRQLQDLAWEAIRGRMPVEDVLALTGPIHHNAAALAPMIVAEYARRGKTLPGYDPKEIGQFGREAIADAIAYYAVSHPGFDAAAAGRALLGRSKSAAGLLDKAMATAARESKRGVRFTDDELRAMAGEHVAQGRYDPPLACAGDYAREWLSAWAQTGRGVAEAPREAFVAWAAWDWIDRAHQPHAVRVAAELGAEDARSGKARWFLAGSDEPGAPVAAAYRMAYAREYLAGLAERNSSAEWVAEGLPLLQEWLGAVETREGREQLAQRLATDKGYRERLQTAAWAVAKAVASELGRANARDRERATTLSELMRDSQFPEPMLAKADEVEAALPEALVRAVRMANLHRINPLMPGERSAYVVSRRSMELALYSVPAVLAHEVGHAIEAAAGMSYGSHHLVDAGDTRPLRDMTGIEAYDPGEQACASAYLEPYTAKVYNHTYTEVVSMGVQAFCESAMGEKNGYGDPLAMLTILPLLAPHADGYETPPMKRYVRMDFSGV